MPPAHRACDEERRTPVWPDSTNGCETAAFANPYFILRFETEGYVSHTP